MKLPHGVRRWFSIAQDAQDIRRRVEEELDFHLESRIEDLMRSGLPRVAARQQALREFGDMAEARDELGAIDVRGEGRKRRMQWWSDIGQDVKFAWRGVRRRPGFAAVIVLTLGLGLGVNATTFDLVDRLLFRPPPHVTQPDRVQRIYFQQTFDRPGLVGGVGVVAQTSTAYVDFAALRDNNRSMDIAAVWGIESTLGRGDQAEKIRLGVASANFFTVLGVRPHVGRFYRTDEDGSPHGTALAVLDHGYWQRRFGGSTSALGQTLLIGKKSYTIIGVAPPGFTGVDPRATDVWIPVSVLAEEWTGADWTTSRSLGWINLVGRLRPGATAEASAAELTGLWRPLMPRRMLDSASAVVLGPIQKARGPAPSEEKQSGEVAGWLAGVSLLVLLVACANVANLLLTRAIRQRRETGVRLALGVGRFRLLRQFLVESLLLATLAGMAAFLMSRVSGGVLRSLLLPNMVWTDSRLDERLLTFLLIGVGFTTVAIVLVPMHQTLRVNILPALRAGAREGHARSRMRTTLLFVQAALSVVLLIGASLFLRSFYNVSRANLGFDSDRVLVADIDLSLLGWDRVRRQEFYFRARDHVARLTGVAGAAVGSSVPFWSAMMPDVYAEGHDSIQIAGVGGPLNVNVTPEYFSVIGTRVVRGRSITAADNESAGKVAIVNETMAKLLWPGQEALGKCLYVGERADRPPCTAIVGIAEDTRPMRIQNDPVMSFYLPLAQSTRGFLALLVRASDDPSEIVSDLQRALQRLEPNLPYANVRPLQELIAPQTRSWKLGASLFTVFGVLALILAAVGLYSMLSHAVANRTREVGVRMALGARAVDVVRMIVSDGMTVAVAGVVAGGALAYLASQRVAPLLYEVSARDPLSYVVAGGVLLLVAFLAVVLPARRATAIDPASALRAE
jgi:putative ABC transport system permease protein